MRSIVFLFLFASFSGYAQTTMVMNDRCMASVDHLMNLERDSAMALIAKEKTENPSNAMVFYLLNLSDFLTTVVTEDEAFFNQQEEKRKERLKLIGKVDESNPYRKFALAEVNLQWAFSRLRFGEYFTAAMEINRAFHLLEKNIEEHPDFLPNLKGIGLLHTLIGTVPDKYRWATNLMGMDGTVTNGLNELKKVVIESRSSQQYQFLEKESLFLYAFMVLNLTSDKSELENVAEPMQRLSLESPMIAFAQASALTETGKTAEAIALLETCGYDKRPLRFHYLDHLLGSLQLYSMDRKAERALLHYRNNFKGKSYLKANQLKLAYHRLIFFNSEEMYQQRLEKIGPIGSTMLDEDKQAQKAFEKGVVPNLILLKSRLRFDGGFYKEALQILTDAGISSFSQAAEKLEFDYRSGRIHHKMGNTELAITFYRKSIENHNVDGTYFPANACLKLGEIYESQGNRKEATKWYEASMEYSGHEYENSIEQKAKAGISRVEAH